MSNCIKTELHIEGDNEKGSYLKMVKLIANGDSFKEVLLASYFKSDRFANYIKEKTGESDFHKVNWNTLKSLMNKFYKEEHLQVQNTANRRQGKEFIFYFDSTNTMRWAKIYTAELITKYYSNSYNNGLRLSNDEIIQKTIDDIFKQFIREGKRIWQTLPENSELVTSFRNQLNRLNENRNNLSKQLKDLKTKLSEEKDKKIKEQIKEDIEKIHREISYNNNNIYGILNLIINKHGDIRAKGYSNLLFQIKSNPKAWLDSVFSTTYINKYKREFESAIENQNYEIEYYEEDDINFSSEEDSLNAETRRWNDDANQYSNPSQMVNVDIKLYLSTIYELNDITEKDIKESIWNYNTDNVLGVAVPVGAENIINQISNVGNFNSVKEFVDRLELAAKQIKGLEHLAKIASDCRKNNILAYRLFHELAMPKITKAIIDIENSDLKNSISNAAVDPITFIYFNLQNTAKFTIKEKFNIYQRETIRTFINRLTPNYINANTIKAGIDNQFKDLIKKFLTTYFPNINPVSIDSYFNSITKDHTDNYREFLELIEKFLISAEKVINNENNLRAEYQAKLSIWRKRTNSDAKYSEPKPIFDYSSIRYDYMDMALIEISKLLAPYTVVKNELNSFNAEGNLGSDLIGNNYLTNLIKQITYGTEEDANAGLQKLGEFIIKAPQYDNSPIFWGVYDSTGKELIPGLFKKKDWATDNKSFTVNPKAKKLISINLFNGIRNQDTGENELYAGMSKADYFLSSIINFHNPPLSILQRNESDMGGFFMRTPSDAPKNFSVNTKIAHITDLFIEEKGSKDTYIFNHYNNFINYLNISANSKGSRYKTTTNKNNIYTISELLNLIRELPEQFNYTGMKFSTISGNIVIPLIVENNGEKMIVCIKGKKVKNNTIQAIDNISIDSTWVENGTIPTAINNEIKNLFVEEGVSKGEITRYINTSHGLFLGFKQHLIGEINTFIYNLNNIFELQNDGKWKLKENTLGLFDRFHYNGELVKDGKLTGNVFKFLRLFSTTNYNVNEAVEKGLFLYGGGNTNLLKVTRNGSIELNVNSPIINIIEGKISLNYNSITNIVENIVKNWITDFINDIHTESLQYKDIIGNRFTQTQIDDAILNSALMNMNFDDLFEGDFKFYKNSRDFFKRAKEVQASGKSYGGYTLNDTIGGPIEQTKEFNDNGDIITIGDITIPVRNGFKGVTIKNTVRPSDNAENIYKELLEVNKDLPDSTRKRIALQIARGFGYKNEYGKTKTNDAQSYITIEEFIRRRYLDGTLNKYMDILPALLDPNADISKLNIQKINAFIQVQKNFYFDKQFDTATQTVYARQIKNAEFVLIPALIKGTSLGRLYDIMKAKGIDQINTVETDKAAKRTILTYWDNNGQVTDKSASLFSTQLDVEANKESYYYRYLYKQQDVVQHMMNARNKAGIQIMKKILDNASPKVTKYINDFFEAYCANIKVSFESFLINMGWEYEVDKFGRYYIKNQDNNNVLNFDKFYEVARFEASRLGLDSNFIDYITPANNGATVMPNFMNIAATKLESIAQSMFNTHITRQTLPGWHGAQVTNVGYDSILHYHDGYILIGGNSSTHINNEDYKKLSAEEKEKYTKCAYAEVRISRWSNLIPKDYDINKLAEEGLDLHIGYRIPTEGKQSVAILKVVEILDDVQGSTIIVPDEWVTQTGSDFDVDSVYGISYEMYYDKKEDKLKKIEYIDGEDSDSIKTRYKRYLRKELKKLLADNKEDIYIKLTTENNIVNNKVKVLEFLKTGKGIDFLTKQLGIMSYTKFSSLTIIEQQGEEARNNKILDCMINILQHTSSREENYSRSNYDELTDEMKFVDDLRKYYEGAENKSQSPYNPNDQITYMENATSGMALKAISVTRDTFNSLCNVARATLNNESAISIIYDLNAVDKDGNKLYDAATIKKSYGDDAKFEGNIVTITHKMWGHSLDNRNVRGMLLTPYSSQTTAHILDAVKEGSIFNENKYTFNIFKTLVDLGSDYHTAILFLQQPGITEIVNAYNESNSIYSDVKGKPIEIAIKNIAHRIGITVGGKPINNGTSIYAVYKALAKSEDLNKAIKSLTGGFFSSDGIIMNGNLSLNQLSMIDRFKTLKNSEYDILTAAKDIITIMQFAKIANITNAVEKTIRCTNPDKFGAKQSVFSTRKILNDIEELLTTDKETGSIIMVKNKPLLEALYPNILKGNVKVKQSVYPYLAAFIKYSTMQSIDINSKLFFLESDGIYNLLKYCENIMGIKFDDAKAKAFHQYIVNDIYSSIEEFKTNYTVDKHGWFKPLVSESTNPYYNEEVDRINGYVETISNVSIKDLNDPKEKELEEFAKLTPAQKVIFMQEHFEDSGVFKYIRINKWNNRDILKYNDTLGNIEDIYIEFSNSFFNSNPLFALATLDLIKYAFVVEGFKFKRGGISKIITNDSILADYSNKGLDIVNKIREAFTSYAGLANNKKSADDFIEKFVRSHSDYFYPIYVSTNKNDDFAKGLNTVIDSDGVFNIPNQDNEIYNNIRDKLNITSTEDSYKLKQQYVVFNKLRGKRREKVLYKLVAKDDAIYGYPLNKLEENENTDYSYNSDNNRYKVKEYYEAIINMFSDDTIAEIDSSEYTIPEHEIKHIDDSINNPNRIIDLSESNDRRDQEMVQKLIDDITDYFESPVEKGSHLIVQNENIALRKLIPYGVKIIQNIPINGEIVQVYIQQYNPSKVFKNKINGIETKTTKTKVAKKLNIEEENVLDEVLNSGIKFPKLYKITPVISKEAILDELAEEEFNFRLEQEESDDILYSVTPLIDESELNIDHDFTDIDQVALDLANAVFDANYKYNDELSKQFISSMQAVNLDVKDTDSIHNLSKDIYKEGAVYYEQKANELIERINNFVLDDETGETFDIGDPKLYSELIKKPKKYNDLIKLILDCYTFGNQFKDIVLLDITGEDANLTSDINKIKNTINKITSNIKVKQAMANIFDIYLANIVSTNPNIRHGLIHVRDTFGDIDWWDHHFSDIGFINNNQVQTVVAYINSHLNATTRFEIPKLLDDYDERVEEIMKMVGTIDWNNIVDKDGYIIRDFTREFVEKRNEHIKNVIEARNKHGVASKEYWRAKLEADEWFANNVNQKIDTNYYHQTNANLREVLTNAEDEFIQYQTLLEELRNYNGNPAELTRDELIKRKDLLAQISYFTSDYNFDGTEKTEEEKHKLSYIKKYKERKKEINDIYFDTKISDEITETINSNVEIIKNYDAAHPDMTLEQKLQDDKYKAAYDWLQYNTTYEIDEESNKILLEQYAKFEKGENDKRIRIQSILKDKDVYDEYGNLDPRKISDEDMAAIRKIYTSDAVKRYEEDGEESKIINFFNTDSEVVIGTDNYYNEMANLFGNNKQTNKEKDKIATKINKILLKGVDENGNLSVQLLFTNCTEQELNKLDFLVNQYNDVKRSNKFPKEVIKKLKLLHTSQTLDFHYTEDLNWAINNLSADKLETFLSIFSAKTKKGKLRKKNGRTYPNPLFYRRSVPKEINYTKTNARRFINNTIKYKNTPIYEQELENRRNNNTPEEFENWYNLNHIYNIKTHKYEPLPIWRERIVISNDKFNPLYTQEQKNFGYILNINDFNPTYQYNPIFELTEREVKEEYLNIKYNPDSKYNYNSTTGNYNSGITRNAKEEAMAKLFEQIMIQQATTGTMRKRAEEGFMPRRGAIVKDGYWYIRQLGATFGIEWATERDRQYSDNVNYETDRNGDFSILQLLRKKGSVDINKIKRIDYKTDKEYEDAIEEAKKNNQNIDNEIRDNDWISIMKDYIEKSAIYNKKEELKYTSLLLIEDLKRNDPNKINHRNEISINRKRSTNYKNTPNKVKSYNTLDIVENWHRRLFRNQYKKKNNMNSAALLMQNLTSAKYMIFNVTGGIANVWTGVVGNIFAETMAEDYLSFKDFAEANTQYIANAISYFSELYSDKSSNLTNALIKRFNVVDYEAMSERRPNETTSEYIKRMRNWMYGLQSSGEHYMQNTVMLGMLKSHRVFKNANGNNIIGSFQNYIWEVERKVLQNLVYSDSVLKQQYDNFIKDIKDNIEEIYKYETLQKDINVEFLKFINNEELINNYIAAKEQAIKDAEKEFNDNTKHPTLESLFELKNGRAVLKENAGITEVQLGKFTNKVIYVNKQIHGVYDKIGAAIIEREWWGSLVMQYHKHLYPGIMKRWRIKGYYNEQSESYQKGSYISAFNLLTTDFDKAIKTAKQDADGNNIKMVMKSIQNISLQAINNMHNIKNNYKLLPKWEQNNIKRSYGDVINTLACIAMAIAIHYFADDDDLKESNTLSTMVYLVDRFSAEAQSYTPWGAYTEAKTLWSSPIAATNSPGDLLKLIGLINQSLFSEDFDATYSTGLYKDRNKFEVLLTRNIPIIRIKNRLEMMSRNNDYYRLNKNIINTLAINIAERLKD